MKNLFRLVYVTDDAINLDKEENKITGELLNSIGVHIDKKFEKEIFFTISKYEQNGILKWTLQNNQVAKDLFINSKSVPTKDTEVKLSPGEKHPLKCLLDEKIYFFGINSKWDNLHFDKIKVQEEKQSNDSKNDNEPMEINIVDLEDLIGSEDNPETIEKIKKKSQDVPPLSAAHELNRCMIEDKEEEIQRWSIFNNGKSLEELLDEYNLEEIGGEIINNKNNNCAKNAKSEPVIKNPGINVSNIQTIPTKHLPVAKIKKIVDDDEDRERDSAHAFDSNRHGRNYVLYTPFKSTRPINDELMTEDINKLLEDYREQARKDSFIEASNKSDVSSNRASLINISAKYGADFNSNDKRMRPPDYSKEINAHFSVYSALKTKRLKKAPENKELKIDTNTTCAICLENITFLANLDKCSHDFCKPCIIEWSTKYSNVCPLCKKDFKKIIYYEKNKKKEIKVKKKKFRIEEEDFGLLESFVEESSDNCMVCNSNSDFPNMLVCDGCHYNVCHTYCDGLDSIPYEDWFCSTCRQSEQNNRRPRQVVIDDIEEDQVEDDSNYSDDSDNSYEPQIQLNEDANEIDLEEYVCRDNNKEEEVYVEKKLEENLLAINASASSSSQNESVRELPVKNKRGRPRKNNNNSNNNFNNLRVNINVNVNMTAGRRGRKISKNIEMDDDSIRHSSCNSNIIFNSNLNDGNLNNIRVNSSLGNYSTIITDDRNRRNSFNNVSSERGNFNRSASSNQCNKRGRPKNR